MPISKINPDGTLVITRKSGADPVTIKPEQLAQYNPSLVDEYSKILKSQNDIKNIGKDTKEKEDPYGATMNFINNLEGHYQKGGGGSYGDSPLARVFGGGETVKGMLGLNNEAKLYNDEKSGFVATLKDLTGDTGVMTDVDANRLAGLLPGMSSTTGEATGHMDDIRSQLAAKYGESQSKTTLNPQVKNLLQMILPETSKVPERGMNVLNNQAQIQQQVGSTKGDLGKSAQSALLQTLGIAPNVFEAAAPAATELAAATQIPGMAKGGLDFLKKIPGAFSTNAATQARSAAAQGVTVKTKELITAGEKYVNDINPAAKKAWETLKPAIKNTTDADELLAKLTDWGNKAYTQSGDVRAIAEGQLKEHLYKAGRDVMRKETPEIAKYTDSINKTISRNKLLKKLLVPTAVSAGIGIPAMAFMNNLMGNNKSSN